MMRVVCDSNIIVAGLIANSGSPYEVLKAWRRGDIVLLVSEAIIAEVVEALGRPFFREKRGITQQDIARVKQSLEMDAVAVSTKPHLKVVREDPDDDRIIECALEGNADYLVSGDKHLLTLRRYRHLPIVSARELLVILQGSGKSES